jgi:hypothetical protein
MNKELLEQIKKTVVFIGALKPIVKPDGTKDTEVNLSGTGFLVQLNQIFFLITAKHVIANVDHKTRKVLKEKDGLFVFSNLKSEATPNSVKASSLDELRKKYPAFYHSNDAIDLALIPFPVDTQNDDIKTVPQEMFVKNEEIFETYDVFFVSFQPGISDLALDSKVSPIIRKGSVARVNKNGSIYIDGAAFPGNSGSPVFIMPSPIRYTGGGISLGADNLGGKYLGTVSEYKPYSEVAISQQTGRPRVVFEENTGLSMLWTANHVLEVLNQEEVKKFVDENKPRETQKT